MLSTIVAVALVVASAGGPAGAMAPARASTPVYYLSLGDSLAASYQPNGDVQHGYAEQLFAAAHQDDPNLTLHKLGCGGATSDSMIDGTSWCQYRAGSQLAEAVAFLSGHRVAFVTIDIGVNDILNACLHRVRIDLQCEARRLPHVQANLATIVDAMHAAGGSTPILAMTYYDPYLGLWLEGKTGRRTAHHDERGFERLNAAITETYLAHGAQVADVAGKFRISDWKHKVPTPTGPIPVNVKRACAWTWFCSRHDIHANTAGYGAIAAAFEAILPAFA
jgi:lysophospholipase L1-like esterase